jgi:hypothetical protein
MERGILDEQQLKRTVSAGSKREPVSLWAFDIQQ